MPIDPASISELHGNPSLHAVSAAHDELQQSTWIQSSTQSHQEETSQSFSDLSTSHTSHEVIRQARHLLSHISTPTTSSSSSSSGLLSNQGASSSSSDGSSVQAVVLQLLPRRLLLGEPDKQDEESGKQSMWLSNGGRNVVILGGAIMAGRQSHVTINK